MYKMISIDCDGTLLNSSKKISEENVCAIQKAKNNGLKIVIASARPYYRLIPYLEQLDLIDNSQYTIAFNGALIVNNGTQQEIYEHSLSKDDIVFLLGFAEKYNKQVFLYTKTGILANYYDEQYIKHNANAKYNCVDFSEIDFEKEKVYKFAYVNTPDVISSIKDVLKEKLESYYEVSSSVPQFIEVVCKNITKSFALSKICQLLSIDKANVIAFGDEDNDIPMMKFAGFSVAMGNGSSAVKEIADYISTTNDENGVAVALKHILGYNDD